MSTEAHSDKSDDAAVELAASLMQQMTPEDRMQVMQRFCVHCGSDDPRCQCWNDE